MSLIPTRLLIVQRLQAVIEMATAPDGYGTTLAGNVHRGRNVLGEDLGDIAVGLIESPRVDATAMFGNDWNEMRQDALTILLQGKIKPKSTLNTSDRTDLAYYLQANVEQALSHINAIDFRSGDPKYPEHFNLGGLITEIEIGPPVVRPPEDIASAASFFFQPIRLGVTVAVSNPYTQV